MALCSRAASSGGPKCRASGRRGGRPEGRALVGSLLPTLRAFLDAGGNETHTAEVLFVQRRTLYYRLDRLTAILGLDLDTSDAQHRLQLAVRGHDLLQRPSFRRRPPS